MVEMLEPAIRAQVAALCQLEHPRFEVEEAKKGVENGKFADRFVITHYCCLERLRWHVVYNLHAANQPPDVIFGPEDETFQPMVSAGDELPSQLVLSMWGLQRNWSLQNSSQLLHFILLLRQLYQQHQRRLVEGVNDDRVRFELMTMAGVEGLEMCLVGGLDKPEEVQFSVPVGGINFEPLGPLLGGAAPGVAGDPQVLSQAPIELQVKFILAKGGQKPPPVDLKLMASPAVLDALRLADARLPGWTETTCLMEYLPVLQAQLQQQVEEAGAAMEVRKAFIAALLPIFGRPLEADTVQFRRASVFVICNGLCFLLHLSLPSQFPKQQPVLMLQSSQHFDANGRPILSRGYDDYPWSPRWDSEEMLRRIRAFIQDETPNFKKLCNDVVQRR